MLVAPFSLQLLMSNKLMVTYKDELNQALKVSFWSSPQSFADVIFEDVWAFPPEIVSNKVLNSKHSTLKQALKFR